MLLHVKFPHTSQKSENWVCSDVTNIIRSLLHLVIVFLVLPLINMQNSWLFFNCKSFIENIWCSCPWIPKSLFIHTSGNMTRTFFSYLDSSMLLRLLFTLCWCSYTAWCCFQQLNDIWILNFKSFHFHHY